MIVKLHNILFFKKRIIIIAKCGVGGARILEGFVKN